MVLQFDGKNVEAYSVIDKSHILVMQVPLLQRIKLTFGSRKCRSWNPSWYSKSREMSYVSEGTDFLHLYSPAGFAQNLSVNHSTSIVIIDFGSGLLKIWKNDLNKACAYICFPHCDRVCA